MTPGQLLVAEWLSREGTPEDLAADIDRAIAETLRDRFAAAALTGLCARNAVQDRARLAYEYADDALAARDARKKVTK